MLESGASEAEIQTPGTAEQGQRTEAIGRIADRAVQINGGMGYMEEAPIEAVYREVRGMRIFEGTSEIQRLIVSRDVLKNGLACMDYD